MNPRWLVLATAVAALLLLWVGPGLRQSELGKPEGSIESRSATGEADRSRRTASRRDHAAAARDLATGNEQGAPPQASPTDPPSPGSPAGNGSADGLAVDASGNFFPDSNTIERFESVLSTPGQSFERSLSSIRAGITERLDPPAETQALEFLDRYVSYRNRGVELGLNKDVTEDFRPRFAQLRSLRREFFGIDVAQRLFGAEERADNIAIRESEIAGDPDLSEEERAARLAELYNPPPEQHE